MQIRMLAKTTAKEVQAALPLTFYRYILKEKFTISQVLSGSLVICPSSGVYSPIDKHKWLLCPCNNLFQTKMKILGNQKSKNQPKQGGF